jgi:hypothetical protein
MATATLHKPKRKMDDWVNPASARAATLEEYRSEMQAAEQSGFVSVEDHKKSMNEWLAEKL